MSQKQAAKAVVFGGSGFLGSHVADILSERGIEVTIFDRAASAFLKPGQKMIVGDVLDQEAVRKAIQGQDYVFHLAGLADIDEAKKRPIDTVKINILGTTYILDACREFGIKRFIFASTIYVYSEYGSFYRSSKQACELLIENYKNIYDVPFTILRFGSLYGSRANPFNSIRSMIRQALTEKRIRRVGNGEEVREYVHVHDAAQASVDILSEKYVNTHVMISGQQTMRIKDLITLICEILGSGVAVEYVPGVNEEHYQITPYSFKPRVAKKYVSNDFYDMGQGILESVYEVYHDLVNENKDVVVPVDFQSPQKPNTPRTKRMP